jgi:hypothetical protein
MIDDPMTMYRWRELRDAVRRRHRAFRVAARLARIRLRRLTAAEQKLREIEKTMEGDE